MIGALCALAASALATPTKDTRLLRQDIDQVHDDLAELLTRVAQRPARGSAARDGARLAR